MGLFDSLEVRKTRNQLMVLEMKQAIGVIEAISSPNASGMKNLEDPDAANWTSLDKPSDDRSLDKADQDTQRQQAIKFFYRNPHCRNIVRIIVKYVVGRGFAIIPESPVPEVAEWWKRFWKINKMELRKREIVRRVIRDGEAFIRFFYDKGNIVIRFMNPDLFVEPEDPKKKPVGNASHGIETSKKDIEEVIAYWYLGERVPAEEIYHIKALVDSDVKRGRSYLEVIMPYVQMYSRWVKDRMKLNMVRSIVGLVRKVVGNPTQAANLIKAQATDRLKAPDKSSYAKMPEGVSVFTTNKGVDYDLKSPNLQAADVHHDGRAILLAIAAGVGMPEFMVTCFDPETEVLTEAGWKRFNEVTDERIGTVSKTGYLEYQEPTERHEYDYTGPMVRIKNQHTDIVVTPNHKLLTKTRPEQDYRFELAMTAAQIGYRYMPTSVGAIENNRVAEPILGHDRNVFAEFLGWYLSEGCVYRRKDRNEVNTIIVQKKNQVHIDAIASVLCKMAKREVKRNARGMFTLYDKLLGEWLEENCGAGSMTKRIPDIEMDNLQREILFKALMDGDGNKVHNCYRYTTVSQVLAGQVQKLAIEIGFSAKVKKEKPHISNVHDIYRVYIHGQKHTRLFPRDFSAERNNSWVWCFTTPNGTLITRRNGKVGITGNSDASNSNYASTMVAEGPAVMEFEDWQDFFGFHFGEIFTKVTESGIKFGEIPEKALVISEIEDIDAEGNPTTKLTKTIEPVSTEADVTFPDVAVNDVLKETQAIVAQDNQGYISKRTARSKLGYDTEEEEKQIARELAMEDDDEEETPGMDDLKDDAKDKDDGEEDERGTKAVDKKAKK